MGQGGGYGSYYNQNPGSSNYYSGYNSGSYNRPGGMYGGGGYGGGGYGGGGYGGGGYYWGGGQKQNINKFAVFFSSLLTVIIYLITA
jgi:hypothetical protein